MDNPKPEPPKDAKIFATVVTAIIFGLLIWGVIAANNSRSTDTKKESNDTAQVSDNTSDKDKIEQYCTDEDVVGGYINLDKYSLTNISEAASSYNWSGEYDDSGNKIMVFTWNGKDRVNNKIAHFACWASVGTSVSIQWLSVDGVTLYGSAPTDSSAE